MLDWGGHIRAEQAAARLRFDQRLRILATRPASAAYRSRKRAGANRSSESFFL